MKEIVIDINPKMQCKVIVSYNMGEEKIECISINLKSSKTIKALMESVDGIISNKYKGFKLTKCEVIGGYGYEVIANPVVNSNNTLRFVVHVVQPLMACSQQKVAKVDSVPEQIAEQKEQQQQSQQEVLKANLEEIKRLQGTNNKPATYGYKEVTRAFLTVSKLCVAAAMLSKSELICNFLPENLHNRIESLYADNNYGAYITIPNIPLVLWGIKNANVGKVLAKTSTALMVCGAGALLFSGEVESLAIVTGLAVAVEATGILGANIIRNRALNYKVIQDSFNDLKAGYYQGF